MSDELPLTECLRDVAKWPMLYAFGTIPLCGKAADEIERLRSRIHELETRLAANQCGPNVSFGGWQYTSGSMDDRGPVSGWDWEHYWNGLVSSHPCVRGREG